MLARWRHILRLLRANFATVMAELDAATPGHAVLASNTSGLSITEIADATQRPHKVVGFHFFWPASAMRLIEVIEGEETAAETVQAAMTFAQQIRKVPIRAAECPGFVVNRILLSTASEVWRYQDESGVPVEQLDEFLKERAQMPMGPFRVADMSGLDTIVQVAQDMQAAYGDRFYVHRGMQERVDRGELGAKSGKGFYEPPLTRTPQLDERIAERFALKAFVEACLVVEEGVAGVREIDLGMMLGTGMVPGPFARADFRGLDEVLAALERAQEAWGEHFAPPLLLRRLVAQGRLGPGPARASTPTRSPSRATSRRRSSSTAAATTSPCCWLDNPPANSLSPEVIEAFERAWAELDGQVAAVVVASPNPTLFCAGADIKAFTRMDAAAGRDMLERMHALGRAMERSRTVTIAAVNGMALGGGCELAMACDVRLAAFSASFGQPEVNLGIIPGFGGTQRLPRLVGPAKALEMNTIGDPISAEEGYEFGLVNRVVADHELFDAALAWGRKIAGQAPLAIEQLKRLATTATSTRGSRRSARRSRRVRLGGRARGHRRLPRPAHARSGARDGGRRARAAGRRQQARLPPRARRAGVPGDVRPAVTAGAAGLAALIRAGGPVVALTGRGHLRAVGDPGLPLAADGPVGERRPDGGRPHPRLPARPGGASGRSTAGASPPCAASGPTAPTRPSPSSSAAASSRPW